MRTAKDLINKHIIGVDEGVVVGQVHEIYFDYEARHLAAIQVAYEGILDRTRRFIPRADVHLIGDDVVLVKHAGVVREMAESDAQAWVRRDQLTGREIVTAGKTRVAAIDDVILGDEGEVAGFKLGRTYIESPVARRGAVSREAILDVGSDEHPMTVDLEKAEREDFEV
ncbi:MAG TPA: PRC-barrel domain-containing protein [Candidatus Sulfomarinibacteraceae bacterium]|nr:PRC-barrel domain-containing protein [Candidatus Sulfomarinibacteraceae bacterium]